MKPEEDVLRIRQRAEDGDAVSQVELGSKYLLGDSGFEKDIAKAIYWYDQAISGGWKNAYLDKANLYHYCYFSGVNALQLGVKKAEEVLNIGCEDYSIGAAAELGDWYANFNRDYLPADYKKAVWCYERAFEIAEMSPIKGVSTGKEHLTQAACGLASMYWHGYGIEKDENKALVYALKSFKDCPHAKVTHDLLKEMFDHGVGGAMSKNLSYACGSHDINVLWQFLSMIEEQVGFL